MTGPERRRTGSAPAARVRTAGRAAASTPAASPARNAAEAFQRLTAPGLPPWLLFVAVGFCAAGTAAVVRLGGRREQVQGAHRG